MPIKITFANKVTFPVKGELADALGALTPFDFQLTARRLDKHELDQILSAGERPIDDVLAGLVEGWSGVTADDGTPVPYSRDALLQLLRLPKLDELCWLAYLAHIGARAKN